MKRKMMMRFTPMVLMLSLCLVVTGCEKKPDDRPLIVLSFGGAWLEVLTEVIFKPFESKHKVPVKVIQYDGQYDWIKTMVEFDSVFLDVVDAEGNILIFGSGEGVLEPIDYTAVDKSQLLSIATHPNGVGVVAWSWVLAYNSEAFKEGQAPRTWKDFFDLETFPGPRGLQNDPRRTLEMALLADGVALENLYPLDLDRALIRAKSF